MLKEREAIYNLILCERSYFTFFFAYTVFRREANSTDYFDCPAVRPSDAKIAMPMLSLEHLFLQKNDSNHERILFSK